MIRRIIRLFGKREIEQPKAPSLLALPPVPLVYQDTERIVTTEDFSHVLSYNALTNQRLSQLRNERQN